MSTIPPISSLGSAPLMTFSSPAASSALIQSRKSLLAIARPRASTRRARAGSSVRGCEGTAIERSHETSHPTVYRLLDACQSQHLWCCRGSRSWWSDQRSYLGRRHRFGFLVEHDALDRIAHVAAIVDVRDIRQRHHHKASGKCRKRSFDALLHCENRQWILCIDPVGV